MFVYLYLYIDLYAYPRAVNAQRPASARVRTKYVAILYLDRCAYIV